MLRPAYPFVDKTRECALGASYGGYMADWILGHTNHFACIVTHDGMFDPETFYGSTDELWFAGMGVQGHSLARSRGRSRQQGGPFALPALVAHALRGQLQDAHIGHPRPARLPARCVPGIRALHHPGAPERSHQDALLPRRRALGTQTPKQPLWNKTVSDWCDLYTKTQEGPVQP